MFGSVSINAKGGIFLMKCCHWSQRLVIDVKPKEIIEESVVIDVKG